MKKLLKHLLTGVLISALLSTQALAAQTLIPGGQVIGIEVRNNTVTVAAFEDDSPAKASGLQAGDQLLSIDGHSITCTRDVQTALERSGGSVRITVQRGSQSLELRAEPQITAQGPKLGVYLRQGVTGIGTVTYYDPQTGTFGALGHGVNDASGRLLSMTDGSAYEARVVSVRKGQIGQPGQLMGNVSGRGSLGSLQRNTPQGIFGKCPVPRQSQPLPIATAQQVKAGPATIRSTVCGDTPREYSVEIVKIYPVSRQNGRNMLIRITDPALLEATGGIVQGMSGSPLVQDGKLIGAVTHVLVNDPTMGYGIFTENMLEAAG